MSQYISKPTINCLKCLLAGVQRPAIRQMRATGEPCCAIHALEGLPAAYEKRSIGRNDPCHCGSGKKFKACHGTAAAIQQANAIKIELPKLEA